MRIMFGTKREEGAGGWRRQHSEDPHDLYVSLNILQVIK
jgi:hypothetical protein